MKCSGSLITCRLPVSLGSTFKSLLDIRKQAFALPVKHHQLPAATDHTTTFYKAVSHTAGGICSCSCIRIIHQCHLTTTHPAQHLVATPSWACAGHQEQPCPCQGQHSTGCTPAGRAGSPGAHPLPKDGGKPLVGAQSSHVQPEEQQGQPLCQQAGG